MQKSSLKRKGRKEAAAQARDNRQLSPQSPGAWGWAERVSIIGLFTLAVGYTLFVMQAVFIPVVTAWVIGAVLRPIVEWAETRGVPRIVAVIAASLLALLILLGIIGLLSTPFAYWIGRTAELASLIKEKLQLLSQPLAIFDEIGRALSDLEGTVAPASKTGYDTSTIIGGIVTTLTPVVTEFVLFFFSMIFWMLYANEIKASIAYLFSGDAARRLARAVLDDAEGYVGRYFSTLAIVNLCLGIVAVGLAWLVGLPNPLLWGVLAGTVSFIPYLGPAIMVATFFVIGVMSFPTLGHAFIAPLAWIGVSTLEGQFITPTFIGHRLTLNPFLVFLSIAFWAWMWGPLGAFLSVPLLISGVVVERHLSKAPIPAA